MPHQITDKDILDILKDCRSSGSGEMTYVIRNMLAGKHKGLKTDTVRRRLVKLEREGKVTRVPSIYAVQICWALSSEQAAA